MPNLPTLPVEALERILFFTFCLDRLSIPSSPFTPVSSTFHLLLISKGFTELVLPHFFHSVTILNAKDWHIFFHPTQGIFVVGEEAQRRRSWVRELNIEADVYLALKRVEQVIKKGADPLAIEDYFIPIPKVEFPNLRRVFLLEADPEKVDDETRWNRQEDRLIKLVREAVLKGDEQYRDGWEKVDRPIREKLEKRKPAIFEGLLASSPIVSVDISLSRHLLHSQIWRTSYPNATIILHVDEDDFRGPFDLEDDEGMFEEGFFDWEETSCYFFDDDRMLLNALPDEFKSMDSFICGDGWTFEKGIVVVGVPEMMIEKICRVVFQESEAGVKAAKRTMEDWVWLEELDDEAIQKEIERGQKTQLNLPPVGTYWDQYGSP